MENISEKEPIFKKERAPKEIVEELYREKKEELEKRELLTEKEKAIREKLEEEIVKIKLSPTLTDEAKKKAIQIKSLNEKGKLKNLLDIVKTNGVAFAVDVARRMNDPYILDIFHDILAREGLYKKFKK
jgi:hypothetical protein